VRPYDNQINLLDRSYKWRISLTSGKGRWCPYSLSLRAANRIVFILATVCVNAWSNIRDRIITHMQPQILYVEAYHFNHHDCHMIIILVSEETYKVCLHKIRRT
jgi:hypothetical protein